MTLARDVADLEARLGVLRGGEAPPVEPAPERKRTVVDYWFEEYERAHGCRDDAFTSADAAILHRLVKQFAPSERFAWMIREFHETRSEWLEEGGWAAKQLAHHVRGLNLKYVKMVQEPELRRRKAELEREIRELERDPKIISLVDRIAR